MRTLQISYGRAENKKRLINIPGDPLSLVPQVHPQNIRAVVTRGNLEDPGQDLRVGRKKRNTGQSPSTLEVTAKRLMALCHCQDSLGAQRPDVQCPMSSFCTTRRVGHLPVDWIWVYGFHPARLLPRQFAQESQMRSEPLKYREAVEVKSKAYSKD
ncbi:hypothetical protein RJ639_016995 [Escallonia herrerae]|uniref:Uncharacterized protein n=1 Tax=Escallonia herrerae TaxID=1293975 RepID=A0AA89AJT5_9ASTE|nr:hypothetical protein RJ639_016995 [Escallonia herrerae]